MKAISLTGARACGRAAFVDDEDYGLVAAYTWGTWEQLRPDGRTDGPYAISGSRINGRHVFMHKLITGWPQTDHVNHDGLDNQRSNLRPATAAQNNHNRRPSRNHSSQYKGVTWHRRIGKWQATIKGRYLGVFASERDAADAYDRAAEAQYGEYAYLNRATP